MLTAGHVRYRPGYLLDLRVAGAPRDPEDGPTLQDPQPGDSQSDVVLLGGLDQRVERGIAKQRPPEREIGLGADLGRFELAIEVRLPITQPRDLGLLILGPEDGAGGLRGQYPQQHQHRRRRRLAG